MANELRTTVKPHIKPIMKIMNPPLPSVLSLALEAAVFLDWLEASSIFLDTACNLALKSDTVCVMGIRLFSRFSVVVAFADNMASILAMVSEFVASILEEL